MKWLSGGCGKDNRLKFLKIYSVGDYQNLLKLFFDVGVLYFIYVVNMSILKFFFGL